MKTPEDEREHKLELARMRMYGAIVVAIITVLPALGMWSKADSTVRTVEDVLDTEGCAVGVDLATRTSACLIDLKERLSEAESERDACCAIAPEDEP